MVKFPEAQVRLFRNKFICRRCKAAIKVPMMAVMAGTAGCRKCGAKTLRAYRKK